MPLRRVTTVFFIGLTVLTVGLVLANNVPLWPQGVLLIALYGVFVTLVLVFFHRYYDRLQHFQRLYAAMREGVALRELILDADGKPWDYRYLEVNPAYERMSEFTRQQLIGKTWRELGVSEKSDWPKEL